MENGHLFAGADAGIWRWRESTKSRLLMIAILACVILDAYATFVMDKKIAYAHFFFIPVILAGVWYYMRAIYVASFLGALHIFTSFIYSDFSLSILTLEAIQRALVLLAVAYLVGFVSGEHAKALLREEKRRAEEIRKRIKAERDNLKLIFESMPDGVYLISADYRVEFMNEVLRRIFGDHVGDICYKVFHNREEPCPRCKHPEVMKGKTVRWEWHSRRQNRTYDLIETPLRNADGSISKLTIFRDITERKKAEDEIRELNRELELKVVNLEEVTKMKNVFLSITSHELKTPLTPMKAQLQMLQEGYMGKLSEKQENSIEIVLRNLARLDKLIADILDISRIEAGRIRMFFKSMNFNEAVKEAIKTQEALAKAKGIKISATLADLPDIVGDTERLQQAIGNLLNNAIKFSKKSGTVVIKTERSGEDNILFSITDYGIGISKADQKKLFLPFSQIDTSMAREHQGTGLGLAIAKGIIEAHNGKIWVESEPGKGSTFYFVIPMRQKMTEKEVSYIKPGK